MDCRRFREHHSCYVDDTLPGAAMDRMSAHRAACRSCSAHDTRVRRALMIARSTPVVQPSAAFRHRLATRLATERATPREYKPSPERVFSAILAAAAAAVLVFTNGSGLIAARATAAAPDVVLAPVVVAQAAADVEPVGAPEMFAAVSWSLPVYQAMLVAQRATEYFAESHARTLAAAPDLNSSH